MALRMPRYTAARLPFSKFVFLLLSGEFEREFLLLVADFGRPYRFVGMAKNGCGYQGPHIVQDNDRSNIPASRNFCGRKILSHK